MNCNLCGDSKERNYKVYMHTSPNNKRYIGITCKKIEQRWNKGKNYKNNIHFTNAVNKYGWDNIKHEILFENLTEHEAKLMERFYITYYDTFNPEKGYNLTLGGEGTTGRIVSKDKKKELRINARGKRGVINITTGERFISLAEASRMESKKSNTSLKKINESIRDCCKGRSKTYHNCEWWYIDEYDNNLEKGSLEYERPRKIIKKKPTIKKVKKENKKTLNKPKVDLYNKPIVCLNTKEEFESPEFASKLYNINKQYIINNCKGLTKYTRINNEKLAWKFKDEYLQLNDNEVNDILNELKPKVKEIIKKECKKPDIKVICTTTMEIFDSVAQAGEKYNTDASNISRCCLYMSGKNKGKKIFKHAGKLEDGTQLSWQYYQDYLENGIKTPDPRVIHGKNKRKIRCLETGKIYESIVKASEDTGINIKTIHSNLSGRQKSAKGTHWEYLDEVI